MKHSHIYADYPSALAYSPPNKLGAHAYYCSSCKGWHAKPNVARDWAKQPLGSKPGPKPKGSGLHDVRGHHGAEMGDSGED